MKKKILIGSVFAALLVLSMPFVSNLQAQQTPAPYTSTSNSVQPPATIDLSTISTEASDDPKVMAAYQVVASILYTDGNELSPFCEWVDSKINDVIKAIEKAAENNQEVLVDLLLVLFFTLLALWDLFCEDNTTFGIMTDITGLTDVTSTAAVSGGCPCMQ